MKRKTIFLILLTVVFSITSGAKAAGNRIHKQTFVFAVKGTDTLALDKYEVPDTPGSRPKPVLLFAFGGGFKGGDRAESRYLPFFHFLAQNGYVVVSTDYRTALKGFDPQQATGPEAFVKALELAIRTAVEDFFDATRYVTDHSKEWNIDANSIIACGSSAGAITALQSEYEICNRSELVGRLPASFRYAGVIAFAGAIASVGQPEFPIVPCPIMLFHGNADKTVPFEKAVSGDTGLWGSATIAAQLDRIGTPYYFYKIENAGHEVAVTPLSDNLYAIMSFLTKMVAKKEKVFIRTDEQGIDKPEVKKDFTLEDYLRSNL
ncbi:MAG: alpha/beta hydrolase fold domain-containing protein [Parabacteroides sp.]|nr:alpha/beta hydrolase fold domain-containing protein [Parabacteroides sp.]